MYSKIGMLAVFVLAMMVPQFCAAEETEEEIALDKVPKVVLDAAAKRLPGFTAKEAERETEDGVVVYELEGVASDGKEYEIEISAAGKVLEVEVEEKDDDDDDDDN